MHRMRSFWSLLRHVYGIEVFWQYLRVLLHNINTGKTAQSGTKVMTCKYNLDLELLDSQSP